MPARPFGRLAEHADLSGGPNPYTVERSHFITAPECVKDKVGERVGEQIGERVGAQMGDARSALLRVAGSWRGAALWAVKYRSRTGGDPRDEFLAAAGLQGARAE